MQTECLHPVIKNIEISSCMKDQPEVVQNVLKPLYKIHNGQDQIASYFNLQSMDGNLNILKGKAVADFILGQYSTVPGFKQGPIDFVSHFKNSKLVRDGIIDADTLAGEVENTLQCFPLFFLFSLHPSLSLFFYPSLSPSFLPASFTFHHHHSHAFLYSLHTAPDHNNNLFPFFLSYFLSSLMLFFPHFSGKVENTMRSIESPYLSYLENLNMGGETDKKKEKRSEELIQSMIQAFGKMFEGDKSR
jgi:hypothetical protein